MKIHHCDILGIKYYSLKIHSSKKFLFPEDENSFGRTNFSRYMTIIIVDNTNLSQKNKWEYQLADNFSIYRLIYQYLYHLYPTKKKVYVYLCFNTRKLFFHVLSVRIADFQLNLRSQTFAIHVDLSRAIVWLFK